MKLTKTITLSFLALMTAGYGLAQGPGMGSGPGMGPGSGMGFDYEDFPGWNGHELEHNMVLPQVAVGENVTTTVIINNMGGPQRMGWLNDPEDFVTTGKIHFFAQNGEDLVVSIDGVTGAEFQFSLEANEVQFLEVTSAAPGLNVGWLLIEVDENDEQGAWGMMDDHAMGRGERVMVTAYYSITDAEGQLSTQVGVMPGMFERGHFLNSMVTAQFKDGVNTGIAIVNTTGEDAEVVLTLRDTSGTEITTRTLPIPAGNQTARFIDELFGAEDVPNGFRGVLELTTDDEGIVSMGLLQSHGVLTSIPMHHYGMWTQQ